MTNPTFQTLAALIDWTPVGDAIARVPENSRPFSGPDLEDAKELVWLAAERWLASDFANLRLQGTEKEVFINGLPDQRKPFHGFVDGIATVSPDSLYYANILKKNGDDFRGATLLWDWKTTEGNVESEWKYKQIDSWQWKLYAFAEQATLFSYRGLSRSKRDTNEALIAVPACNGQEVREYLTGAFALRHALVDAKLEVWPRRRPNSCNAFNRPCPFDDDCDRYVMPRFAVPDRQLSYSSINDLLLCPERHRRKSLAPDEREETEQSNFGSAVHRGLEELYRQAKELQGNG